MQFSERTGEVMVMNVAVQLRSVVWVGEIQLGRRSGGGDGDERSSSGEVNDMGRGDAA